MKSTMQDAQLTIGSVMKHGTTVHGDSEVVTATTGGTRSRTYAEVGARAAQLAHALRGLGIDGDQRVATFMWNNAEHLEAYLAIPSMGAVLHTLNIRLFPEQLVYIANHAEDRVVIVDDSLVPLLAKELPKLDTVTHVLVSGPEPATADLDSLRASGKEVLLYEDLLADQPEELRLAGDRRARRRGHVLHQRHDRQPQGRRLQPPLDLAALAGREHRERSGLDGHDRVLPIVPMFHANAWGLAYAAIMTGASLCMPDRWLQAEPLVPVHPGEPTDRSPERFPRCGTTCCPTSTATTESSLDSLKLILCGGSAVPVSLQRALEERHGLYVRQAWGMTETSPVASAGIVPARASRARTPWAYRGIAGPAPVGVEGRIVGDDGSTLPWDGARSVSWRSVGRG